MWRARSVAHVTDAINRGCRTWLCTLTLSPSYVYVKKAEASNMLALQGKNFERCPDRVRFKALDRVIYRDIQKFLKRLRSSERNEVKGNKARNHFTYLCVTERTPATRADGTPNAMAGEPHYHLLIHETIAADPLRQSELMDCEWPGGFAHFKLASADPVRAAYVVKYLSKDGGRVRASKKYGWFDLQDGSRSNAGTIGQDQPLVV